VISSRYVRDTGAGRRHNSAMVPNASRVLRPLLLGVVPALLGWAIGRSVAGAICDLGCIGLMTSGLTPMYVATTPIAGIAAGVLRSPWPILGWVVGTIYGVEAGSFIVGPEGPHSTGGGFVATLYFILFLPAAVAIWGLTWQLRKMWRKARRNP